MFLILYDIEFTFLFPILFNLSTITVSQLTVLIIFLTLLILSLFYDFEVNALN